MTTRARRPSKRTGCPVAGTVLGCALLAATAQADPCERPSPVASETRPGNPKLERLLIMHRPYLAIQKPATPQRAADR